MRSWLTVAVIVGVLFMCGGCGNKQNSTDTSGALLPAWAPENPSPEFVRAAKILKPMPVEPVSNVQDQALDAKLKQVWVPAWEFFGTLSDEEISRLQTSKEIDLRYDAMRQDQRDALNRYLEVWRETMKNLPQGEGFEGGWQPDLMVELYKYGAREDLSNVLCKFKIRGNNIVAMFLHAVQSDGSLSRPLPLGLGSI